MRKILFSGLLITLMMQLIFPPAHSQSGYTFSIVNMVPTARSSETNDDGEPNLAVNPINPDIIAASAFTFASFGFNCQNPPVPCTGVQYPSCRAPIYLSTDGGATWTLKHVLPSNNGITHDITLAFSAAGYLYVSILKGCHDQISLFRGFITLRSATTLNDVQSVTALTDLVIVDNRFGRVFDQPWIITPATAASAGSTPVSVTTDQVFIGANRNGDARPNTQQGRTAVVMVSNRSPQPGNFFPVVIESETTAERDLSGIRVAAHSSGKTYAVFYRWKSGGRTRLNNFMDEGPPVCDVVVVRDDSFALGTEKFMVLKDGPGNSSQGRILAADNKVPISYPQLNIYEGGLLGRNRLVGSNLAIAVDPNNDRHVFAAWCANNENGVYTLYLRQNRNGGQGDWQPLHTNFDELEQAINPAMAITQDGKLGMLYQKYTQDQYWETHFRLALITRQRIVPIGDYVLSRFSDQELPQVFSRPAIGEYIDLEAIDNSFYGIFPAVNTPDATDSPLTPHSRFPTVRPLYNRHQDSLTGQLLDNLGNPALNSVDPFFFKAEPLKPVVTGSIKNVHH